MPSPFSEATTVTSSPSQTTVSTTPLLNPCTSSTGNSATTTVANRCKSPQPSVPSNSTKNKPGSSNFNRRDQSEASRTVTDPRSEAGVKSDKVHVVESSAPQMETISPMPKSTESPTQMASSPPLLRLGAFQSEGEDISMQKLAVSIDMPHPSF